MKNQPQAFNTMQMVREIRDKLGKLRRENPKEYFRQVEESGRRFEARRKRLSRKATA